MQEQIERGREQKTGFIGDLLNTCVKYFKWVVLAIVLMILISGIRTVKQGEVAVVLRFGKLTGDTAEEQVHEPGLLFAFPYIIDEVITVPVGKVFEVTVDTHYTEGRMGTDVTKNGYCITGDQNIAVISTSLKYTVSDPVAYALYTANMEDTVRGVTAAAITSHVAGVSIDSLLTDGKDEFAEKVLDRAQDALDALGCGVALTGLDISSIAPPTEVKLQFDSVNSATVSVQTKLAEAEQYREMLIPSVESSAQAKVSKAKVNQQTAVAQAKQFLAEFYGLLDEYERQPDVVVLRVYNQKLAEIYAQLGDKLIVPVPSGGTP
jgi:membrane protease subunit HflK